MADEEKKVPVWNSYDEDALMELQELNDKYKKFLSDCKTERESTDEAVRQAKEAGYVDLKEIIASGRKLSAGDKVYAVNMGKALAWV